MSAATWLPTWSSVDGHTIRRIPTIDRSSDWPRRPHRCPSPLPTHQPRPPPGTPPPSHLLACPCCDSTPLPFITEKLDIMRPPHAVRRGIRDASEVGQGSEVTEKIPRTLKNLARTASCEFALLQGPNSRPLVAVSEGTAQSRCPSAHSAQVCHLTCAGTRWPAGVVLRENRRSTAWQPSETFRLALGNGAWADIAVWRFLTGTASVVAGVKRCSATADASSRYELCESPRRISSRSDSWVQSGAVRMSTQRETGISLELRAPR
jgi:hypothetical protein